MSNKTIGNTFEEELCNILYKHGFWVHNMVQNKAGQPADIICARNGKAYLIDAKVCSNGVFKLDRVEENQELSMSLWLERGNGQGWFAMKIDDSVYMIPHFTISTLGKHRSSIYIDEIIEYGKPLEKWVKWCK